MYNEFVSILMDKLDFPEDAVNEFSNLGKKFNEIHKIHFDNLIDKYMHHDIEAGAALEDLNDLSNDIGVNKFTLHLYFFMHCSKILFERYKEKNISEDIYWNTVSDLKYKMIECHDIHGVWGSFVSPWFSGFFTMNRFALGRFQYEEIDFQYDEYNKNGISVKKGDKVYNLHIPSSGAMSREFRIDSYRQAYRFFSKKLNGRPLIIVCKSWLLYPKHKSFLPEKSNIIDFMLDFEIIDSWEDDAFSDAWRIFGKDHALPPDKLPATTSLQKAYATRLINGEKTGGGFGVLLFDGKNILK